MQPYYVTRPKDATLLYDLTIYGSGQGIHMGGLLLCWPLSLFKFDSVREKRSVPPTKYQVLHIFKILLAHWLTIAYPGALKRDLRLGVEVESEGLGSPSAAQNCYVIFYFICLTRV